MLQFLASDESKASVSMLRLSTLHALKCMCDWAAFWQYDAFDLRAMALHRNDNRAQYNSVIRASCLIISSTTCSRAVGPIIRPTWSYHLGTKLSRRVIPIVITSGHLNHDHSRLPNSQWCPVSYCVLMPYAPRKKKYLSRSRNASSCSDTTCFNPTHNPIDSGTTRAGTPPRRAQYRLAIP